MPTKFEFLEHTADAKFKAYGTTLEEAFENVAMATMNVMIDTTPIKGLITKHVELESSSLDDLVVDWLSEILFLFEVEEIVFGNFKVESVSQQEDNKYKIVGEVAGEPIDPSTHKFNTHAKAVTYNGLQVTKENSYWVLQVTIDT
nr:archease [Methanosalsum natronophilum]